jgi:hypothetical protein
LSITGSLCMLEEKRRREAPLLKCCSDPVFSR